MWKDRDETSTTVSLGTDLAMDATHRIKRNSVSSVPTTKVPRKSALRVLTQDESLHGKRPRRRNGSNKKQLQFDTVEIREYKRTVGDNPSCSSGPPLAIGWEYDPEPVVVPVREFEEYRPPRRSQFELMLGRQERHEILEDEWQIPQAEIADAIRKNIKAKNQRLRTLNNIGRTSDMEEKMENVRRKLKMPWSKNRPSKDAQDLVQVSEVVQQRQQQKKSGTSITRNKFRERRKTKEKDYPDSSTA